MRGISGQKEGAKKSALSAKPARRVNFEKTARPGFAPVRAML
jgi:hypothetical protein